VTHLGNMLYLYRASQRVEQKALAEMIGLSASKLGRIEHGIGSIDAEDLLKLCAWLIKEVQEPRQMQAALSPPADLVPA